MTKIKHYQEKYPLVCVAWRDSHSNHGWRDEQEIECGKLRPIAHVGFLIKDDENCVVITGGVGGWNDLDSPCTIPRENVIDMWKLKKPRGLPAALDRGKLHRPRVARRRKA